MALKRQFMVRLTVEEAQLVASYADQTGRTQSDANSSAVMFRRMILDVFTDMLLPPIDSDVAAELNAMLEAKGIGQRIRVEPTP